MLPILPLNTKPQEIFLSQSPLLANSGIIPWVLVSLRCVDAGGPKDPAYNENYLDAF